MNLLIGDVVWAEFGPPRGRVQAGRRPAVVVASNLYLAVATTLALVVPVSSRDRGWGNHVPLTGETGLHPGSFALTEQLQLLDRDSIFGTAGSIDEPCLGRIRLYLRDFLDL